MFAALLCLVQNDCNIWPAMNTGSEEFEEQEAFEVQKLPRSVSAGDNLGFPFRDDRLLESNYSDVGRPRSAEPMSRTKSPGHKQRTKRTSGVERPRLHFHRDSGSGGSDEKKERRRRKSSSSERSGRKHRKSGDEPNIERRSPFLEKLDEKLDASDSSVNKQTYSSDVSINKTFSEGTVDSKDPLRGELVPEPVRREPEVVRATKPAKFATVKIKEAWPDPPKPVEPEIVRSTKSSKFRTEEPIKVEIKVQKISTVDSLSKKKEDKLLKKQLKKDKKESKKEDKKAKKKKKRKNSSSSSSSAYSYSSDSDVPLQRTVSKLVLCEVPESSNRPPAAPPSIPPPRPARSDQKMESHVYENYPCYKNGSNAPALMSAEIVKDPVNIPSPLKRKNSDLKVPPSPSQSPLLRRKGSTASNDSIKSLPDKNTTSQTNPSFKFGFNFGSRAIIKQPKQKEDKKLDRRVSVAASIFGDVVKRRPPTHRHVEPQAPSRTKSPLDEINTKAFTLRKTVEGGAINLEKPTPGVGRVVGEAPAAPSAPRVVNRRASAPTGPARFQAPEPPNILDEIKFGRKLKSVAKPVVARIGLGKVVGEPDEPDEPEEPLLQIPQGNGPGGYVRLLSDIKEMGDNIEDAFDGVVGKVTKSSPPSAPPAPRPSNGSNRGSGASEKFRSGGLTILDQLRGPVQLRKVPRPEVKVYLKTETDHLDDRNNTKTAATLHPPPTQPTKRLVPLPKLIRGPVSVLNIPPAKLESSDESHSSSDESESIALFKYRKKQDKTARTSYAAKTAAILTPPPIFSARQFLDEESDRNKVQLIPLFPS